MDWTIGAAFANLKDNSKDNAKNELAYMSVLQKELDSEDAKNKQAQLEQQKYDEEISKFADKLLAPDRERINKHAQLMAQKVKEHIRNFGGDLDKFNANGGLDVINDYKNSVIKSKASTRYLNNKKNLEQILKVPSNKQHLLLQSDKKILEDYNNGKDVEIKYSGLLSDVDFPKESSYEMNSYIPPQDILHYKDNYTKIYGNYSMTFPDDEDITDEDLLAYTKIHYTLKGSKVIKSASATKYKKNKSKKIKKIKELGKLGPNTPGYSDNYTTSVAKMIANTGGKIKAKEFHDGYWDKQYNYQSDKNYATDGDFDIPAKDYADNGDGEFMLTKLTAQSWTPKNAKKLRFKPDDLLKSKMGDSYKIENGTLKNFTLDKTVDWFDASGRKVSDWNDQSIFGKDDYLISNENANYKAKNVITIATTKTANGKESMIMNPVHDNGKIDNGVLKEYNELLGDNEVVFGTAIVLEDENGNRFYVPYDINNAYEQSKVNEKDKALDTTKEVETYAQRDKEQKSIENQATLKENELKTFWDTVETDDEVARVIYNESSNYSPAGSPDYRADLLKSFYGISNLFGSSYRDAINNMSFSSFIEQLEAEGYKDIKNDLMDFDISAVEIMNKAAKIDPDNKTIYANVIANYKYLKK